MGKALGTVGGIVGGIGGFMAGGPAGAMTGYQLGSGVGSALGGGGSIAGSISGASNAQNLANQAVAQQRLAAQAGAFRPVGMTTAFGTSQFKREIDPATGLPYISSAGYTASPELAGLQSSLMSGFAPTLSAAQSQAQAYTPLGGAANQLFNLGQQYLATSPEAAAQDYISKQQALLGSSRENQLAGIRNRLFQTGRGGLGVQTGTGGAPASPEMQAYYNALAQQDLQLAAQADQAAMARQQFGAGLFGTGGSLLGEMSRGQTLAYSPLQTQLGLSGQVEQMSQQPYNLGVALGSGQVPGQQISAAGLNQAGAMQYAGGQNAANIQSGFLSNLLGSAVGSAQTPSQPSLISGGGFGGGLFGGSQGGFNFGALGRAFGVPGRTSTGLLSFD
jgi:hypothetical protein